MGKSEKKCPNCGKWSGWEMNMDDRCEHCGARLAQEQLERKAKMQAEEERQEREWMFRVDPSDPGWLGFFKKVGNLFYIVFMAIMTFIMWIIAALPG